MKLAIGFIAIVAVSMTLISATQSGGTPKDESSSKVAETVSEQLAALTMSMERNNENELLADRLFELQENQNNGRGVSCVRQIAESWRRGDILGAQQIATMDDDKIRGYPEIRQWLEDNLFGPDIDSPLKMLERLKELDKNTDS